MQKSVFSVGIVVPVLYVSWLNGSWDFTDSPSCLVCGAGIFAVASLTGHELLHASVGTLSPELTVFTRLVRNVAVLNPDLLLSSSVPSVLAVPRPPNSTEVSAPLLA